ncbi:cytochrome P450 [Zychaea mexicana]|uniref:cytochrome P450 n=1 Tax=Zychaea mexicana TaxID=64656 RepID=UPI0022FDB5A3|nr:cytochrome P450 [Zychaea mexicana]KAI9488468.1 cytochrome P450 [Zychaea mexicana]
MGKFHEWHKELGPVFRFKMGVSTVLVVSDISMTHELLATMGKLTSNRPESATRYDFDSNGHNRGIILSQSNDKHWSVLRKSVLNALGPRKLKELSPVLCKEADEFVNLVATGENIDPLPQLMRVSLNFILLTLFSIRTTSLEDPLYKRGIYIVNKTMSFTHFKYIASQFIPVLRVIEPIIGNRKKAIQFLKYECKPFYLELVEKAMNAKDHNMTKAVNEEMNQGKEGYYNNLLPTIHDMILAGTDTTAVTISWGFLQISTRPEIQKKIQQEIDVFVTQNGRVPYFWERNEVPYLIATQRECLRLRPTTDLGVTHAAVEDFEWRGSLIPKGTSIMANMVEAHMDPEKYPDPEEFRPERFLDTHDTMASSANMRAENRDQYNFGWGRRICVGTHLVSI